MIVDILKDNNDKYIENYINDNKDNFFHYNVIDNIIHIVFHLETENIYLNLFYNLKDNILFIEKISKLMNKQLYDFQLSVKQRFLINSSYIGEYAIMSNRVEDFLQTISNFENYKLKIKKES